jgi:hypothetical protein
MAKNHLVPLEKIDDDQLRQYITSYHVRVGIRTVEEFATDKQRRYRLSPEVTAAVNDHVSEDGYGFMDIALALGQHDFEQILDTVRTRLLDFILKLDKSWHIDEKPPSKDTLSNMVSVTIYNQQGGSMAVFDQRGQHVNYQYNAAGNINFDSVKNSVDVVAELEKLQAELAKAAESGAIDEDAATDAEYQLKKAVQQAKKPNPEKKSILDHLTEAKAAIEGVAAAAGLVVALTQAAQVVQQFFK